MKILGGVFAFIMEILETIVFIGSLFMVTYLFICQPNKIQGASMEPTFYGGQYIFTSKVTYKFRPVHRGDVVVIHSPKNYEIEYIKRIIALPGDTINIQAGEVFVNNIELNEPYIAAKTPLWDGGFSKEGVPVKIPDGEIFVMGDNRPKSSDSREFGPVPVSSIIGEVFYRYYPANKMGVVGNPFPSNLQSK
jgi:signal peptidase I